MALNEIKTFKPNHGIISNEFVSYFENLFTSNECREEELDKVLSHVPMKMSDGMNDQLLRPFLPADVKEALFSMSPYKSPGKDGLGAGFFQKFWDTVGSDVCKAALDFLDGQGSLECVNETIICLIPKVKEARAVTDYRPISLCNVIYKIVTKMMTNRLREVLGGIISEEQRYGLVRQRVFFLLI